MEFKDKRRATFALLAIEVSIYFMILIIVAFLFFCKLNNKSMVYQLNPKTP
jgi:hypothetical protein